MPRHPVCVGGGPLGLARVREGLGAPPAWLKRKSSTRCEMNESVAVCPWGKNRKKKNKSLSSVTILLPISELHEQIHYQANVYEIVASVIEHPAVSTCSLDFHTPIETSLQCA